MKKILVLTGIICLACAVALFGADKTARKQRKQQDKFPPEVIQKYDENKNGILDKDELQKYKQDVKAGLAPKPNKNKRSDTKQTDKPADNTNK